MKRLTIAVTAMLILAAASAALAQEPGDIGFFFDPAGTQTTTVATAGIPFAGYVIGFDLAGDVFGYEFNVIEAVGPFVLGRTTNPATALDVGPGDSNFIVGTGVCLPGAGPFTMITYNILLFAPMNDALYCIEGATPSSDAQGRPAYLTCGEQVVPLGVAVSGFPDYPDACGIVNATGADPVATDALSFGALKAGFGE